MTKLLEASLNLRDTKKKGPFIDSIIFDDSKICIFIMKDFKIFFCENREIVILKKIKSSIEINSFLIIKKIASNYSVI